MDMSNFRPELHIAQQSRRDKLRIPQDIWSNHNLEQIPTHHNLTYESAGNICYDPPEFCSEMINFSANPHGILKDAGVMGHRHQEREASFHHFSRDNPMTTSTVAGAAAFTSSATHDPQYFSSDWVPNHSSIFVGEAGISSSNRISMPSSSDGKPNYPGYQELSHNNSSGEMNVNSSVYQNALQELVTSSNNPRSVSLEFASLRQKSWGETGHGSWVVGGSELLLLPAYADQMRLKTHSDMTTRPVDGCSQWIGGDRDFRMAGNDNSSTQGLSLSLSSVPSPKVHETHVAEKDFQTRDVCGRSTNVQESRISKLELSPNPNLSTGGSRILGTHPPLTHRNPGPLGPFTGYATILRNSKFLRPAQLLLEEFCCIARPKDIEICDVPDKIFEEVRVSREAAASNIEPAVKGADGNAVVSSLMFDGLSDRCREPGGMSCSVPEGYRPENLQKKAKLLYMQDEVCKKYKQYHQQMQLVVSSFESVAGLTAATPFVSLALKMIVKHFRSLKNAITDQLKSIKNALGEESSSPSAGTSGSKGDATNVSMLKFFDQSFQKQKGAGILESQHIWRPQRGLPERAVSILRAWLFDHFLHPYPTDTDKHMLATQTGLTRNQVSNWFINARVRVWKPMVEEIHMLETKAMQAETGSDTNAAGKTAVEEGRQGDGSSSEPLSRLIMRAASDKQQVECLRVEQEADRLDASIWNQDKRSRIEYHVPGSVDGTLMGLVPSHRSGIEIGGMGSVSLTLGLRQSAENAQRPPMQQERHPIPHFGGQIIRDYVG